MTSLLHIKYLLLYVAFYSSNQTSPTTTSHNIRHLPYFTFSLPYPRASIPWRN